MPEPADTPWKRATAHQRALRSERQGAAQEGGRVQPNSGSLPGRKGDYMANGFLVDDKVTDKRSWRLTLDGPQGLSAHITNAVRQRRLPSWRLNIAGIRFRLMRDEDFLYLIANQRTDFSPDADV